MNPNQVRQNENSASRCATQFQSAPLNVIPGPDPKTFELAAPGFTGSISWPLVSLACYVFDALARNAQRIRLEALPAIADDRLLVELSEAIHLAESFQQNGGDISKPLSAPLGLASCAGCDFTMAFYEACYALVNNANLLVGFLNLHRGCPVENNCLAEALNIAVHVVESEGLATPLEPAVLAQLATASRAALIRHTLTQSRAGQGNLAAEVAQ